MIKDKRFWFLVGLVLVLLLIPNIIRYGVILGEEPYYHARVAKQIIKEGLFFSDSFIERPYVFNMYHLLLAGFVSVFGVLIASKMAPILLGVLIFIFSYLILKEVGVIKRRLIVLLLLVLSPVFIYTFSISNIYSLSVVFILMGFFFLLKKNNIGSLIMFALIGFTSVLGILVSLFLLLCYYKRNKIIKYVILVLLVTGCLNYLPVVFKYGLSPIPSFVSINVLNNLVSDLGAMIGFGVFTLLLALLGLITSWRYKKKYFPIYGLIVFLFLCSFYFGDKINFYLGFILCFFAGYGFWVLVDRRWQVKLIKRLTLAILLLGVVFSAVSFLMRETSLEPNEDVIKSLNWLRKNSEEKEVVLSHYSNGFWIEAVAERRVIMDGLFLYVEDIEERYDESNAMFKSVYIDDTIRLLDKYSVDYIWIDRNMKYGEVWTKEKEGMLFLLKNSGRFKNVYNYNSVEIWKKR